MPRTYTIELTKDDYERLVRVLDKGGDALRLFSLETGAGKTGKYYNELARDCDHILEVIEQEVQVNAEWED